MNNNIYLSAVNCVNNNSQPYFYSLSEQILNGVKLVLKERIKILL